MNDFSNDFIQYKKHSLGFPKELSHFQYLEQSFILELPHSLYALNHVHTQIVSCLLQTQIQSWPAHSPPLHLPLSSEVELYIQYTCQDYTHSVQSITHTLHLLTAFTPPTPNLNVDELIPHLYIEDVFLHALDPTHIYGHLSFLATLNAYTS